MAHTSSGGWSFDDQSACWPDFAENFGWLGSPIKPVSLINPLGTLVTMGGVTMATYSPSK